MKKAFYALAVTFLFFMCFTYVNAQEENIMEGEDNQSLIETTEDDDEELVAFVEEENNDSEEVILNDNNNVNQTDNILGLTPEDDEEEIPVQKARVIITKYNEKNEVLPGATLQLLDSEGNELDTWVSGTTGYEILLPNGTYTLVELEAPEGYDIAEAQTFTVNIIVEIGYHANTEYPNIPCEASTIYYVEVNGVRHEVYCINQFLTEPTPDADYNGQILTSDDIRDYTQQITLKDPYTNTDDNYAQLHEQYPNYILSGHGHLTDGPIDVSDQSLENIDLYNLILDIIYRRTLVKNQDRFKDIPDEAISYITEAALKTYTNAGITQIQGYISLPAGGSSLMYEYSNGYYWCLMHMYRDYVYDPSSPNGWRIDAGNGDALGNFARHWALNKKLHETKNLSVDHPEYAELFYYLLGDDTSTSLTHPKNMHIYIYSSVSDDEELYQNLLGITGYLEDYEPPVINVAMVDKYSTKTRDIYVEKRWDDKENYNNLRPTSVTVTLYANGDKYASVELNEANGWNYTFEDLPYYEEGVEIKYTIDENRIPNYEKEITGSVEDGFLITNIFNGQGGDNPNPETADSIYTYIGLIIICLVGLFTFSYKYVKEY